MASFSDHEEIPLPLVQRVDRAQSARRAAQGAPEDGRAGPISGRLRTSTPSFGAIEPDWQQVAGSGFADSNADVDTDTRSRALDISATELDLDRMRPGPAGGIAGLFGGAAAFGLVHATATATLATPIGDVAAARGVDPVIAWAIAYVTAGALGAIVGAGFAMVTRYLRRGAPLLVWSLVFFVSLAMLLLAASATYGRGAGVDIAPSILGASALFAVFATLSLPLRKR